MRYNCCIITYLVITLSFMPYYLWWSLIHLLSKEAGCRPLTVPLPNPLNARVTGVSFQRAVYLPTPLCGGMSQLPRYSDKLNRSLLARSSELRAEAVVLSAPSRMTQALVLVGYCSSGDLAVSATWLERRGPSHDHWCPEGNNGRRRDLISGIYLQTETRVLIQTR